jgi:branched-chain amino acid transport system permease protein
MMSAVINTPTQAMPAAMPRRDSSSQAAFWLFWAAVVILGLFVPSVVASKYVMGVLVNSIILGVAAVAVGFLACQCGLMMFGAAAVTGSATYIFAIAIARYSFSTGAAVAFTLFATTALCAIVGALIMRTRPLPFAMLTLALGQMLKSLVMTTDMRPITGADDGLPLTFSGTFLGFTQSQMSKPESFWPIAWLAICGVVLLAWAVGHSRLGQVLRAITANEERMRFSGFNTYWPRVIAFTLAGFMGTVAGLLAGLHQAFASPELLDFLTGGNALISMLLGGFGTVLGPVLGAVLFVLGQEKFGSSGHLELLTGVGVVLVIAVFPRGAMGFIHDSWAWLRGRLPSKKKEQARAAD